VQSPGSCIKCSRRPALVTPSGLCRECASTADTADPTPRAPLLPWVEPSTGLFRPSLMPSTAPRSEGASRPLPHAPAGYDLLDRLGGGGMGEVYLAREHASERLVAMKFLRFPGDASAYERFLGELRNLAELDHPNIVRVFASDFLRADPFFTMEYLRGGSLSRALDGGTPMPVAGAVRIVRTVAGAVAAAHDAKVIHRDLKPANILLAADGTPKVADFGLAKRLDEVDPITVASGALGTPGYMPPEQISRRNGEIGAWSDVYGLGATLYHLLTGRAPFVGDSTPEIIARVQSDPPARPRALCPDLPLGLEAVVLKCLEKNPKDRYQTIAELTADLDAHEEGRRTKAPPLTRARRVRRWACRNRRGIALSAVVVLAVLGTAYGLGRPGREQHDPVRPADVARSPVPPLPAAITPFTPELTHDQVRDALRLGNKVVLVGETVPRVPLAWGLGSCDVVDAKSGDTRFSLRCRTSAVLQLLPDPGVERYRVRAEFRQDLRVPAPAKNAESSGAQVGLVFGHARTGVGADGIVHTLVAVVFNEHAPAGPERAVGFNPQALFEQPLRTVVPRRHWAGGVPLASRTEGGPGWRELDVEVRAEVITLRHGGRTVPRTFGEIHRSLSDCVDELRQPAGQQNLVVPPWTPRAPLGIIVSQSWVSVRNVSIEPIH
jgi:eukaryotic-like serine/threonine-protein kinase